MKTEFTCSRCGVACATDREIAGRRVRCLSCGFVQRMPGESATPSVAPSSYQLAPAPALFSRLVPAEPDYSPPPSSQPTHQSRLGWREHVRPWVFETSQVQGIGTWLIILSVADLLMTFVLLRKSTAFFESNPIAHWFFSRWNMAGMVFFKFSMIAGVILLSEIIERNRPGWGRFVLLIGCIGAAYAVFTGGRLYMGAEVPMTVELD
jgi:Domain of unknown function (DUF5658)